MVLNRLFVIRQVSDNLFLILKSKHYETINCSKMSHKDKSVEELFRDLGRKIDELIEKGKQSSEGVREDLDKRVEEIKKNKEKLENDFKRFTGDKEKWKAVEESLENAAKELKNALEIVFSKKKP